MTPNEIDKIVSKLTTEGRSQEEIRNRIAIMRGEMSDKPSVQVVPPDPVTNAVAGNVSVSPVSSVT
jgi:hypothetical protein